MNGLPRSGIDPLFYLKIAIRRLSHTNSGPVFEIQKITELETVEHIKKLENGTYMARDKI